MDEGGKSERVALLRGAITRIECGGSFRADFGEKGAQGKGAQGKVALGRGLGLDRALGGGLRRGTLHEVVALRPGDAGAACGFALAMAVRFATARGNGGPVVWILEDGARAETGAPYAPGLAAHGLPPERLLVVRTADGAESLWAMEEALKCRAVAAVVLDLWRTRTYDLVASRRLVLAAGGSGTPGILVAAGAPGSARALCSAAQTRFEVGAANGSPLPGGRPHPRPLPGRAAWAVRLARIRAGPEGVAGFDWEKFWPIAWDHEEAWFCDALPVPAPSLPRDRPHPAARGGGGDDRRSA